MKDKHTGSIWEKNVPGRDNSQKQPSAKEKCVACSRNRKAEREAKQQRAKGRTAGEAAERTRGHIMKALTKALSGRWTLYKMESHGVG